MREMARLLTLVCSIAVSTLASFPAVALTFDPKVPAAIQKQMQEDLGFIATLQGSTGSALHRQVFSGPVDGDSYKKWFESRITSVGLDDCGNSNAVACVAPSRSWTKMWITENYIRFSHPQIARLMVVFHEARHTEARNGFWSHSYCPEPFNDAQGQPLKSIWTGAELAGEPGCDMTPIGSYGISIILLKNIQKYCTTCTDKVKMDAGIYADDQFLRIIDSQSQTEMKHDLSP